MIDKLLKLKNKIIKSGIHPKEFKITSKSKIERAPLPKKVIITNSQHIGAPSKIIVKHGGEVKVGQKIAEASGFVSTSIHATISGKVRQITKVVNPTTSQVVDAIVINSDEKDQWIELRGTKDPQNLSQKDIIDIIQDAGVVGLGGATFPTHVKLKPPEGKIIDTLVVNGCECEPYITADHRMMLEKTKEILLGIKLVQKCLNCKNIYIAIEDNKPDAKEAFEREINNLNLDDSIKVKLIKTRYPIGGEKTLIKELLNREVPYLGLPLDVGVVVQNVSTLYAIYEAIYLGKPLVERVLTVTGLVNRPKNLLTRFGIEASELIDYCGGMKKNANK